ncbi:MAG TPA: carbohydrate-binding domain-containing protein, partial [Polyangiaceae bacterium]|nr:carbohydrate-binding domain-containing protein [Polyangiaceae bacterium]
RPTETLGLELVQHDSTLAFPLGRAHPLFAGLDADALKLWRGDHYVSHFEIRRPEQGGARALAVSGGAAELDQGPIVERPYGAGRVLWLQALVGAKFKSEPAARRLLQNALSYLASPAPVVRPALVSDEPALGTALTELGLDYEADGDVVASAPLLLLGGGGPKVQAALGKLKRLVAAGRQPALIYWHAPTREAFDPIRDLLGGRELTITPGSGPLSPVASTSGPFASVCAEDFLFKGAARGDSWLKGFEADPGVVTSLLGPAAVSQRFSTLALGDLAGTYVSRVADGILFATVGSASAPFNATHAGLYIVRLTASGTPLGGVLPVAKVSVAGGRSASVQLTQKERKEYFLLLELSQGQSKISVEFVNDAASGGEDRNLTVHELGLLSEPWDPGGAKFFTLPPAVAELTPIRGKSRVLVDFVRWPGETKNALRAGRYASALFAALGARFRPPELSPSWLPVSGFHLTGPSPYSEVTEKEITLRSAGMAVQAFEVASEGRYVPVLRARSDPARKVYAIAELSIDGKPAGSLEINSAQPKLFEFAGIALGKGRHELGLRFTNDFYENGEDRNLFVQAVGLRP